MDNRNLQTGSLIIVWLHVIGSIPFLFGDKYVYAIFAQIIPASAIYGIFEENRKLLWPLMILQRIECIGLITFELVMLWFIFFYYNIENPYSNEGALNFLVEASTGTLLFSIVIVAILLVLTIHFQKIVDLLYQQMKVEDMLVDLVAACIIGVATHNNVFVSQPQNPAKYTTCKNGVKKKRGHKRKCKF